MHVEQHAKNQAYIDRMNANPADIVTVYDAICSCDSLRLFEAVLGIEMGRKAADALPSAKKEMLFCRLKADLEVMRNLAPCGSSPAEVLEPGKYFESLRGVPWPQALARDIWLPESLPEEDRYFILGQVFSAITCGHLANEGIGAA